jgi:hypothetical protein
MKALHRTDLFGWSSFDEARNVDFHGLLWCRGEGNVLVDPMPLTAHDRAHLDGLGGVAWIVVTNSDHLRATKEIASWSGALIAAPAAESETWVGHVDRWLGEGDELLPGLQVVTMVGSKTAGELALVLDGTTLITGDLVRAHRAGSLMMLPDGKLKDRAAAVASIVRLATLTSVETVLVGDGWHVFGDGAAQVQALAERLTSDS